MNKEFSLITLADDDEDDRLFFTDALNSLKMETVINTVYDGQALMDYLQHPETILPDILFLDLNMPKKTGIECLKEIKQDIRLKDIVIAIYSTSSSEKDIEDTFVLGAHIYIKKPSDFNELKKIVSHVVTTHWQFETSGLDKNNFMLRL